MTIHNKNVPALRFPEFNEDWEEKFLSDIIKFENGKAHENDIDENGKYIVVNSKFISSEGNVKKFSNKQLLPLFKNDLVMVMSDVPKGKALAKCFYIDKDNLYTLNQRICALRPNGNNNKFLFYVLNRNDYFLAFDSGVGQTNLKKDEVLSCPITLPPTGEEQQKIAAFLTSVDEKIQQLARKKDLLEQYKKGVMQQIFSQEIRFKDDNGDDFADWEEKKLNEVCRLLYGKDQKQIADAGGKYPILGTGGLMGKTNSFLYDKPSVLIGRKGTIDKPRYIEAPFWTVDTLFYTEIFNNTVPKWLFYRFQIINWYLYNEASGVPSLSASTISKIKIHLPCVEEQKKIANFLSSIDDKINLVNQQLEKTQTFKKGLLQQMFV